MQLYIGQLKQLASAKNGTILLERVASDGELDSYTKINPNGSADIGYVRTEFKQLCVRWDLRIGMNGSALGVADFQEVSVTIVNEGIISIYIPKSKEHIFIQIDQCTEEGPLEGVGAGAPVLGSKKIYRVKRFVRDDWVLDTQRKYESVAALLNSFNSEEWR